MHLLRCTLAAFALLCAPLLAQDPCVQTLADEWTPLSAAARKAATQAERADSTGALSAFLERALACEAQGGEASHARVLEQLGGTLHDLGQPEIARRAYVRAVELYERDPKGHEAELDRARNGIGVMLQEQGRLREALPLFEQVLANREKRLAPGATMLLQARINVATCLKQLGELVRAREIEEAVVAATSSRAPEDVTALTVRMNLAATLDMMGESQRAVDLDAELLERLAKAGPGREPDANMVLENRGSALLWIGELEQSREALERALAWKEAHLPPGHPWIARNRLNLGVTLYQLGELARSRALFEQALATLEPLAPEEHQDLQRLRANLAMVQFSAGDLDGARAGMERVLRIWEKRLAPEDPERLRAQTCLAAILQQQRKYPEAIALQRATLTALERTPAGKTLEFLHARSNVAVTLADSGALEEALALQTEALERLERDWPDDHVSASTARANLGGMLARMGRHEEALVALHRSYDDRAADVRNQRSTLQRMLRCEYGLGRTAALPALLESLACACEADLARLSILPERERARALSFLDEALGWLAYQSPTRTRDGGYAARALRLCLEARALAARQGLTRTLREDPDLAPLLARVRELRARTGNLVAAIGPAAGAAARESVSNATGELEQAEERLQSALAQSRAAPRRVDLAALAARLGPDARGVLIETCTPPAAGNEELPPARVVALVLAPDATVRAVDLGSAAELAGAIQRWRAAIDAPLHASIAAPAAGGSERDAARELCARTLEPILTACGTAHEIRLCGNDLFALVPLDALPLGEGLVGERWKLHLSDVLECSAHARPAEEGGALLALGDVDFDSAASGTAAGATEASAPDPIPVRGTLVPARAAAARRASWNALSGTRVELESLRSLYSEAFGHEPDRLAGRDATKEALFVRAPHARWLHIATHGYFAPDSVRAADEERSAGTGRWPAMSLEETVVGLAPSALCGLVLAGANRGPDADGRVDGIVTAEELATLDLSRCELAVLSACESDVGVARAGRSLHTLQNALHAAGARATITSLWKVSDAATRSLMQRFYRALWLEKKSRREALWSAKLALRAERLPTRDWAGWVLDESGD